MFFYHLISFGGAITNLISIISLGKMKVKNHMYKFMVASSMTNFVYLILCGFIFVSRCGSLCSTNKNSLDVILYQLVIWIYVTSCLALMISLNEIVMCLQRYSYITNMTHFKFEKFTLTFTIFILISFLVYMPRLFFYSIVQNNQSYSLLTTSFKSTKLGVALNITASVIRGPVVITINICLSILTDLKFVQMIKRKRLLTKSKNLGLVVDGKSL